MARATRSSGSGNEWDCAAECWPMAHYTLRAYGWSDIGTSAFLHWKSGKGQAVALQSEDVSTARTPFFVRFVGKARKCGSHRPLHDIRPNVAKRRSIFETIGGDKDFGNLLKAHDGGDATDLVAQEGLKAKEGHLPFDQIEGVLQKAMEIVVPRRLASAWGQS
jgi:hypothetical protein